MLITVLDAAGVQQRIVAKGQESVNDFSGSISVTDTPQDVADANNSRSGYLFQNLDAANNMWLNIGEDASSGSGSYQVAPGQFFPPPGFPSSTTGRISVLGTAGDEFTFKEW